MCDTNSNPDQVDFPIPANDDAYKSIALVTLAIGKAIEEGLLERKQDKDDARLEEEEIAKRTDDVQALSAPKAAVVEEEVFVPAPVAAEVVAEAAPVVAEVVAEAAPVAEAE